MPPTGDPSLSSATELSVAITARKLSPIEVTEAFLARIAAQNQQLHAFMGFADTLGAAGAILNLPAGASTTTIESKTNFIAGALLGTRLTGEALPVHRGRRTQVWTTRVTTAEGRLVAVVTQTQMVLEAKT